MKRYRNFYTTDGDTVMNTKIKEQIQHYQKEFDTLLEEREKLVARLNEIASALEQVRGAFTALKGLETEDNPQEKKEKK